MNSVKYTSSNLTKHIWLGLAIFFVVFNSYPVKKFIRIEFLKQGVPVESKSGDHIETTYAKDCTLMERNQIKTHIVAAAQRSADPTDNTLIFFLAPLLAAALIFLSRIEANPFRFRSELNASGHPVPIYIGVCKLQV